MITPATFPEHNAVLAKDQPEYLPLPVHLDGPVMTSCWRISFIERVWLLLTGRLWLQAMTFGKRAQPIRLTAIKPRFEP